MRSGNIKNPLNCYKSGINTYNVKAISMANKDGDEIFDEIVNKYTIVYEKTNYKV